MLKGFNPKLIAAQIINAKTGNVTTIGLTEANTTFSARLYRISALSAATTQRFKCVSRNKNVRQR